MKTMETTIRFGPLGDRVTLTLTPSGDMEAHFRETDWMDGDKEWTESSAERIISEIIRLQDKNAITPTIRGHFL